MTWFKRGTAGVQDWLERTWNKEGHYYLGEWHYHPDATPSPSVIDRAQMRRIAHDPAYHCPEPVLLIIGGIADQFNLRTQAALFVFPAGEHVVPLILDERE